MFKIYTVIRKEITDLVRDRRTMFFMIVFPSILIPLIIGGFSKLTSTMIKKEMDKKLKIAIVGSEFDEQLISYLSKDKKLILINFLEELELEKNILKYLSRWIV